MSDDLTSWYLAYTASSNLLMSYMPQPRSKRVEPVETSSSYRIWPMPLTETMAKCGRRELFVTLFGSQRRFAAKSSKGILLAPAGHERQIRGRVRLKVLRRGRCDVRIRIVRVLG
jgi:hypothetical protein